MDLDEGEWYYATRLCPPTAFTDRKSADSEVEKIRSKHPAADVRIVDMAILQDSALTWMVGKIGVESHRKGKKEY